jgi:hypothetical protein
MRWLADNVRALFFVVGLVLLYAGVSGFSPAAARIVAGVLLIALAVAPYLRRPRKG